MNIPTPCIYGNDQAMSLLLYKIKTNKRKKAALFQQSHAALQHRSPPLVGGKVKFFQ